MKHIEEYLRFLWIVGSRIGRMVSPYVRLSCKVEIARTGTMTRDIINTGTNARRPAGAAFSHSPRSGIHFGKTDRR